MVRLVLCLLFLIALQSTVILSSPIEKSLVGDAVLSNGKNR